MARSTYTEQRYAVCVGINTYDSAAGLGSLSFAESDAQEIDQLLDGLGFPQANRRLLIGPNATLAAINDALASHVLDMPGPNDLVVFYFAGHGVPVTINADTAHSEDEFRTEVFLASYDFNQQKVKLPSFRRQQALGMERLRQEYFEGEGSRKRLFILDSCYSGDFYGPRYRSANSPDLVQGYIQHMLDSSSTGRMSLSSCLPFQKALEDATLGHGRMTYHLLRALRGEEPAAQRSDGSVTANSLFDSLADVLPPDQRPVLGGVQHDIFALVRYPRSNETPSAPAPMPASPGVDRGEGPSGSGSGSAQHPAPATEEEIEQQREQLTTERARLADLLIQKAKFGSAYAPPVVLSGIREARTSIKKIKQTLRGWGVQVADHPDDR